ncbi:MAG: polyphosphate kinase 2 family protein [Rhizobiaceae bacterium]|nr:polyphosphate kinase 2 family protein [Rhizobiaceae bacterium]
MDYAKKFIVKPGDRVRLADIDPGDTADQRSHSKAKPLTKDYLKRLAALQYRLYADGNRSLLVVLQGLDAGGKDGVIRHVFSRMNPQGTSVACFKQPSREELSHDFLWRIHKRTPAKGEVVVFNRSHYEGVLVERVHDLVPQDMWSSRFELITRFEELLAQSGTKILKFYLHISPEEQLERFRRRLEDETRHWKISESDYEERKFWPQYMEAYEDVLAKTSTADSPWFVIPSNNKWFRNLAVAQIITRTMDDMKLQLPPTHVDLRDIQRRYHAAKQRADADGKDT